MVPLSWSTGRIQLIGRSPTYQSWILQSDTTTHLIPRQCFSWRILRRVIYQLEEFRFTTTSSTMSAPPIRTEIQQRPLQVGTRTARISLCGNGNISVNHNTELITRPAKWFAVVGAVKGPIPNWKYTNNIVSINAGIAVINAGSTGCTDNKIGNAAKLAACFSPYAMTHNALIGGSGTWPAGNYLPPSAVAVQFVNYNNANGGDYRLRATSPYHNASTDGKDLGADINAVNSHTNGVR